MIEICKCCGKQLNNLETIVASGFNGFFCDTDCYFRYTGSKELGPETEIIVPSDAGIERIDTMNTNTLESGYVKLPLETYNILMENNSPELVAKLKAALLDALGKTWHVLDDDYTDPHKYEFPFDNSDIFKLLGLGISLDTMVAWAKNKQEETKKAKEADKAEEADENEDE